MANLRVTRIRTSSNNEFRIEFSSDLNLQIGVQNIELTPILPSVLKPEVLDVIVSSNLLYITTNYLTPYAYYYVTLKSTDAVKFCSKDFKSYIMEDGENNVSRIQGRAIPGNTIKNALIDNLKDNTYNLDGDNFVSNIIDSQSEVISRALYDIGQVANDNYLEHTIYDEKHIRGTGPWDRLNQEGAFEISRVGLSKTDFSNSTSLSFDSFPGDRITLQTASVVSEELVAGTGNSTFDDLVLTVNKSPVTKLKSVTIYYQDGYELNYDISVLGYQMLDTSYDTDYGSTLYTLKENQFKLSENLYESQYGPPASGDVIVVGYEYKYLGRNIDNDSVVVSEVINVVREVVPPIITEFSLENALIVSSGDNISTSDGIDFLDPRSCVPFTEIHPAFIKEIPYDINGLPAATGEYSVDYENGRVFVYGATTNDGTGVFPPVATYSYRKVFVESLDYTYNSDLKEVVANPLRDLVGIQAKISFNYENVLIPGIDYIGNVHIEALDERIDNNLLSLTSLRVKNTPITNVFRLYNETTGELYPVNRFSNDTVYFSANTYPQINDLKRERVSFEDVLNETLIVSSQLVNTSSIRVFKIDLLNKNIIGATEDLVGSSFNTSIIFSRTDVFSDELYYDGQTYTVQQNINKLSIGNYVVDYINGVIYVGVAADKSLDIGTINYKKPAIVTENKHIISVSKLYHNIDPNSSVDMVLNYSSFNDTDVFPISFSRSDERFLNSDTSLPYININGQISVSDDIKDVRFVFDLYDLNNNESPISFANGSSFDGNVITLSSVGQTKQTETVINISGGVTIPFISDGIEILRINSILRKSDGVELWDSSGIINDYDLTLSGIGTPLSGEEVIVNYQVQMNGGSTPIVDYNRGDYYIDYSYLQDEILVSYEWGDNVVDFRSSSSIDEGKEYYVTYKVGALRDSLLANFGTLVDLPIMQSFDTSLPREVYRDALQGALQSFTRGPTKPSMESLIKNITKITPEIIETVYDIWTLGVSNLYQSELNYSDNLNLVSGKFDNGVLQENPGETITFPISSNVRIEEGTMEMFVIPSWDGLDNDALLTFRDLKVDGYDIDVEDIYIGFDSHHPVLNNDGSFSVSRFDEKSPVGLPSEIYMSNKGLFIYYDEDLKIWNFLAKDELQEKKYEGKVFTSGEFYDVKFKQGLGENGDVLRSLTNEIKFKWNLGNDVTYDGYKSADGYVDGYTFDGITFMSDDSHYLFDLGESNSVPGTLVGTTKERAAHPAEIEARKKKSKNRMSIYKDGSGYLNFEVYDANSSLYKVSANISNWKSGQKHFISTSWKINTFDRRDEIHLFVDGVEVPNVLKYGGRPTVSTGDIFRTVKPEIVVGTIPKKIIKGNNLQTVISGNVVYSPTVDFEAEGIVAGDSIDILEIGFGSSVILSVTGNSLVLDNPSYSTLNDARYTINKFSSIVSDEVNLSANVSVSILSSGVETELPGLRADFPAYTVEKNSQLETVLTLYGPAEAGDQVLIRTLGLNHRRCRDSVFLWGDVQNIIKTRMPPPTNLDEVKITSVVLPLISIGPNNSTIVGSDFVASGIIPTGVSNQFEGRKLSIRITNSNVNFSNPVIVLITGTSDGGSSESVVFTSYGVMETVNKWQTITDITVTVTPVSLLSNSVAIEIKEALPITNSDGNTLFPIIRYSYQDNSGTGIYGGTDGIIFGGSFSDIDIGKSLVIQSPASVVGTYLIINNFEDGSIEVSPAPAASFVDGIYKVYNTTIGRSGFQNGFFSLEVAGQVGVPYPLLQGRYELDYSAWLEIPFINVEDHFGYIGSDFTGERQSRAVIDEFRVLSRMLTDVRVGETIGTNEKSVTTDSLTLRPFNVDSDTLMLVHFDELPIKNEAYFYKIFSSEYLQSASSVNSDFVQSLLINERPYVIENKGILSTSSEGSIEFWISPRFDTINDPVERFYFDATSMVTEELVSLTNNTVYLSGRASEIYGVYLSTDQNNTGTDYFVGGKLENDSRTVKLGKALPYPQTKVKVSYISSGFKGDRVSIFKDKYGFLNFRVNASGKEFVVRQPIFWQRDTWHRIFVSFKFNRKDNRDELRMFVDGRESGTIRFGEGQLFGQGFVFGQTVEGEGISRLTANIDFKDILNRLFIGSTFERTNIGAARFDNFKTSNISRNPLICSGISIDENFQSNLDIVKPVVSDLYTLYLMNFNQLSVKNDDFATLRDDKFGIFNFIINVIDSFDIVSSNEKVEQMLRELILALKPAQSKVTINVVK